MRIVLRVSEKHRSLLVIRKNIFIFWSLLASFVELVYICQQRLFSWKIILAFLSHCMYVEGFEWQC